MSVTEIVKVELLEEEIKDNGSRRRKIVTNMINNYPLLVPIRFDFILPEEADVHLLLFSTQVLKVHGSAHFLSDLHLLAGLVSLVMLPYSLPVVYFDAFYRPDFKEHLAGVMEAGEVRQQIIRAYFKDIDQESLLYRHQEWLRRRLLVFALDLSMLPTSSFWPWD